jgi:acyl carrier protein
MTPPRREIEQYILGTLVELSRDWDYARPIDGSTRLFGELGFESLDAVVLGTAIQEHYRRSMPFAEMLADLGRTGRDLTIDGLVDFVEHQLETTLEDAV